MTPLQAAMLSQSMALIGSIIAREFLDPDDLQIELWQENIAKEMRKAFHSQLSSMKLVDSAPRPKQRPAEAQPGGRQNGNE